MTREFRRPPGASQANEYGEGEGGKTPGKRTLTDGMEMMHRTMRAAPMASGGERRTVVGVGEEVTFTVSRPDAAEDAAPLAGTWSFSDGSAVSKSNDGQTSTLVWRAARTACRAEIKFIPQIGAPLQETFEVIAPKELVFSKLSEGAIDILTAGADMSLRVTILPISVSFAQLRLFEVSTGPVKRSGYFEDHPKPDHVHQVTTDPTPFDAQNRTIDHAAMKATERPWERGHFEWHIPNRYMIAGDGELVDMKDKTIQTFDMDEVGTCTVSKGGQAATRSVPFIPNFGKPGKD